MASIVRNTIGRKMHFESAFRSQIFSLIGTHADICSMEGIKLAQNSDSQLLNKEKEIVLQLKPLEGGDTVRL